MLELGGQLSVLLGKPVANLEDLLTWSEGELLRVTSGDTEMQHTRAQVDPYNPPIIIKLQFGPYGLQPNTTICG